MTPYTRSMIRAVLGSMPSERLSSITSRTFQLWPAQHIERKEIIDQLIANERARRAA